jgi:hypothetical protein
MAGEVWVANMKGANVQIIDTNSNKDENKLAVVSAVDLSLTIKIDTDGETHGVAYREN